MAHPRLPRLATTLALLLAVGAAQATEATGLYLDLPKAAGTATAEGHAKWIDLYSLQWGVGVAIGTTGSSARTVSAPSFSDIVWTQGLDTSVPRLTGLALRGTVADAATFDLVRGSRSEGRPYLSLKAETAAVTGVSMSNNAVSASLGYSKFSMTYDPATQDPKATSAAVTTSYDRAKHETTGALTRAPGEMKGKVPAAQYGNTEIYLRLGDASKQIAGDSQTLGYENWIPIHSAQMGIGVAFDPLQPKGGASKPSISELTWTQDFDATVPVVLGNLLQGKAMGQATIEYVTWATAGPVTFMQLALDNVLFSGLALSAGSDARAMVSASMNFTGFSQTVWDIRDDGSRGPAVSVGYDLLRNRADSGHLANKVAGFGTGNLAPLAAQAGQIGAPGGVALVPEPQSWALMLAGGALLAGLARRRRGAA